jgi:FkbM family methyltransferase
MGIGAQSALWRRLLFRAFAHRYFRRRGRTADGSFDAYVSPGSSLRLLDSRRPIVDAVHASFIERWVFPGAVVWDAGANLGLFALCAALKASRVYAFEPNAEVAHWLKRSVRLPRNRALKIEIIVAALSDADGAEHFQISKFSTAISKLENVGHWNDQIVVADETTTVPTLTIDTLAQSLLPPDVLKIDVEGAEMKVLRGGTMTIGKHRPVMLVEGPHILWPDMKAFFAEHHYVMFDGAAAHQEPVDEPTWDTVAVPYERL